MIQSSGDVTQTGNSPREMTVRQVVGHHACQPPGQDERPHIFQMIHNSGLCVTNLLKKQHNQQVHCGEHRWHMASEKALLDEQQQGYIGGPHATISDFTTSGIRVGQEDQDLTSQGQ